MSDDLGCCCWHALGTGLLGAGDCRSRILSVPPPFSRRREPANAERRRVPLKARDGQSGRALRSISAVPVRSFRTSLAAFDARLRSFHGPARTRVSGGRLGRCVRDPPESGQATAACPGPRPVSPCPGLSLVQPRAAGMVRRLRSRHLTRDRAWTARPGSAAPENPVARRPCSTRVGIA